MQHARRLTITAAVLSFAFLPSAPAQAQQGAAVTPAATSAPVTSSAEASAVVTAPTPANATSGVRALNTNTAPVDAELLRQQGESRPVALMIVGGAGLLVGSVIGDDAGTIIAVAGGVILLVGLYRFLR